MLLRVCNWTKGSKIVERNLTAFSALQTMNKSLLKLEKHIVITPEI